jgi:hypothetical protein
MSTNLLPYLMMIAGDTGIATYVFFHGLDNNIIGAVFWGCSLNIYCGISYL